MVIHGRTLILGMLAVVTVIAILGYSALHKAARLRFAIGIYAERPGQGPGTPTLGAGSAEIEGVMRLPLHRPIVVRIEKGTAGRSSLRAVALLLSQEGELFFPPQIMEVGQDAAGKPTEQTRFPELTAVPTQGLVSAIVVRLPEASPATVQKLIEATKGHGPVHLTYSRLLSVANAESGHAEMLTTEVRPGPTEAPAK